MTTWLVTRHSSPGTRDWAAQQGIAVDEVIAHLDVERVQAGDMIIGTLPVNLAAEVCARGARYLHLSLDLPAAQRGCELMAEDMLRFGARIEEYRVQRTP